MEIRKITPEENILKLKIQSVAFLFSHDFSKDEGSSLEHQTDYSTCRAAFDDDGKMCSCLDLIPFEVRFDGKTVKSGGIGGVSSLPEERQKRYIRKIFESIMAEMYEDGYTFSYLYPFSHPYYRKFGYELNMLERRFSTSIQNFKNLEQTGHVKLYPGEAELSDIQRVYDEFIRDKNLPLLRTEKLWKNFLEKDPYKDNVYLYVWYGPSGKAGGYVKFSPEKVPVGTKSPMNIQELIWLDAEAFRGILAFLAGLSAQMDKLVWNGPEFIGLQAFIPEPYEIGQEIRTHGMNRIVNAEKALEQMATPAGSGEVTLAVRDDFFPRNSGNFTLSWDGGSHSVTRARSAPDLSCDIQALSQLVTGFAPVSGLKFAGKIEVQGSEAALSQVFPGKPLFISNYF